MDPVESQFHQSESDKYRQELIKAAQMVADGWPDMIALFRGMVQQAINDGWTEYAARSLVLSSVCSNSFTVMVNIPGALDGEQTQG